MRGKNKCRRIKENKNSKCGKIKENKRSNCRKIKENLRLKSSFICAVDMVN